MNKSITKFEKKAMTKFNKEVLKPNPNNDEYWWGYCAGLIIGHRGIPAMVAKLKKLRRKGE